MDILVVTETKLENYFSNSQFLVYVFCQSFRIDRNRSGGGVICVWDNILSNKTFFPNDIEGLCVELNFRKRK